MPAEITVVWECLDEINGYSDLIGTTPVARATARMWCRRFDMHIDENQSNGFGFAQVLGFFRNRLHCIPAAAGDLKATAQARLAWLDGLLEGKEYLFGDRHSLAGSTLFVFLACFEGVGQPINRGNRNVCAVYERVKARRAAAA